MNPFVRVEYICGIILYPEAQCVRGEGDVQYAPLRTPNTQENKLINQCLFIFNVYSGCLKNLIWQFYITLCPVGIGVGCISKWLKSLHYFQHIKLSVPKRKI